MRSLVCALAAFALLAPGPAAALYKCLDGQGGVTFQHTPCRRSHHTRKIEPGSPPPAAAQPEKLSIATVKLALPGVGIAVAAHPRGWHASTSGSTIRLESDAPDDPGVVLLTIIPLPDDRLLGRDEIGQLLSQNAQSFVAGSVEQAVQLRALDAKLGPAVVATFTDARYVGVERLPPGEFRSLDVGMLSRAGAVVTFSILSDGAASRTRALATASVRTLVILDEGAAAPE